MIFLLYTDLFKISTNSVTGPLLPRVALAICWAAFAILSARLKHRRALENNIDNELVLEVRKSLTYPWYDVNMKKKKRREEKYESNERGDETFLRLWCHLNHRPRRGESMHKPLDIDQASLKALLSTGHKENTHTKLSASIEVEKFKKMIKHWRKNCTPVALWVKVSLFSTPKTLILCKVPIIRWIAVTCALESYSLIIMIQHAQNSEST